MGIATFVCRNEEEREWLLDMNRRLKPMTTLSGAVLGVLVLICLPWFEPVSLVPIFAAGAAFPIAAWLLGRTRRLEVLVYAWLITQALVALAILLNHRQHSGDLALMILPMIGAAGGFVSRVVWVCAGYTALLMIGLGLGINGQVVLDDPPTLIVPVGLLLAVTIIATAVRRSSMDHRTAAVIDPLTGMLNRSALVSRCYELTHQAAFTGQPVALLAIDIDHFKQVNDEHGHAVGDEVLRDFAYRLRKDLGAFGLAYRLGGEEFLVLLPGADADKGHELAERLRVAIAEEPLAGVCVTASVGVAASEPGTAFDFQKLFGSADAALYEAKRAGRNRVHGTVRSPARSMPLTPVG